MNKYAHLAPPPQPQPRLIHQCVGKVRLPRLEAAEHAVKVMERKYGGTFNSYFCMLCGGYHVGHRVGSNS